MSVINRTVSCIVIIAFLSFSMYAEARGDKMEAVRKPMLAGTWYPADPVRLRTDIETYIADAREEMTDGSVVGIIAPHAGYMYSGAVAAHAYKAVRRDLFDVVILVGPSHRAYFKGASIYDGDGYETPLGITPIEKVLAEKIVEYGNGFVSLVPDDCLPENSLEIQVPFIQVAFGTIPFVPILMGTQDLITCKAVADAIIQAAKGRRFLMIASSDFSHYHSYDKAVAMDSAALAYIEKMDDEGFLRGIEHGTFEACGAGPVAVTTMVAREMKADTVKVFAYMNSGDITGEKNGVVGYAAVVLYQKGVDGMHGEEGQ